MKRLAFAALVASLLVRATPAAAHPVPFSYLDVHVRSGAVEISLVAHIFDVAHDLRRPPERFGRGVSGEQHTRS